VQRYEEFRELVFLGRGAKDAQRVAKNLYEYLIVRQKKKNVAKLCAFFARLCKRMPKQLSIIKISSACTEAAPSVNYI
jgi:hypothetical protein